MTGGIGGRNWGANRGENLLIFEVVPGMRPQAHRAPAFLYSHDKSKICSTKCLKSIQKIIYKIKYIFILYRLYIACKNANYYDDQKKRWARWNCGLTPRELLIDRASETSSSVPNAPLRPHSHGQYGKIERKNADVSVVVGYIARRYSLKVLNFEEKLAECKKYDLVEELKYEEN
jgi:hypothetical protein